MTPNGALVHRGPGFGGACLPLGFELEIVWGQDPERETAREEVLFSGRPRMLGSLQGRGAHSHPPTPDATLGRPGVPGPENLRLLLRVQPGAEGPLLLG